MVNCKFKELCENADVDCDYCQYNWEACLHDNFEWNGEGEEPTQAELDEEMH